MIAAEVVGPLWCDPGLDRRGGRYPLSVEAPVMNMVDTLVPGVSTLTRLVRYYALYWALADHAEEHGLDAAACQELVRRAEVTLALVSVDHDRELFAHGVDRVKTMLRKGTTAGLAELGRSSYSPRAWGFWSQYNGPSITLGTVDVEDGALRPGRHRCPASVRRMFQPMIDFLARDGLGDGDVGRFSGLAIEEPDTADLPPLRDLFTATRHGRHRPEEWNGDDHTRRATLRMLARAVQRAPGGAPADAFRAHLAYGDALDTDPVLVGEERARAWRGVLLRHHSVGAWRRLWAALVDEVIDAGGTATRDDLHAWVGSAVSAGTVRGFVRSLPGAVDATGHPLPAEEEVLGSGAPIEADLAVLLIGAQRLTHLRGRSLDAFLGRRRRSSGRGQFLDPTWVAFREAEHGDRPLAELARAFVDDMLAQSRRVALRKLRVDGNGRMTLFSKLHERNGRYFADQREGMGNVGLRIDQLAAMARQLGLLSDSGVTALGADLLEPAA
ncbi:hypothetical protein [Saccharothrix variisporea]|uniref:Uncharacterized protein n=1 Tax=Saccharothrix variisporea TaxID=543527 RepID=A0A495XMA1_9PSEU|nr:hypothetical protein [Saccharothrix variisporea]RKT74749.1 hypothetical protein DFJ66_8118 [Saccharothrix variisporea]